MQDHDTDMGRVHYRPNKGSTVCGAAGRVADRQDQGQVPKGTLLKVKMTTYICEVDCPGCRRWVKIATEKW